MAKKSPSSTYLTHFETLAGGLFLLLYLLLLPLAADGLFRGLEYLMGTSIGQGTRHIILWCVLLALTLVIFYQFVGDTTRRFLASLGAALAEAGLGLVLFYGLNELAYRILRTALGTQVNLNDLAVSAQNRLAPQGSLWIVVLAAPFVEEVLFRGYVFGAIRGRSRTAAYAVSCALYAALYVWNLAAGFSLPALALALQYLIPGFVLAWCYDRTGTLWTPILVHMTVNALALF